MNIVVFLQNAWSPHYAGRTWPRRFWLEALWNSRSGERLRTMMARYSFTGAEWWFDNTTPIVGDNPNSRVPADPRHIRRVLGRRPWDAVVVCGTQARDAAVPLAHAQPAILIVPHPAYRVLSNDLYAKVGDTLSMMNRDFVPVERVMTFSQRRGRVETTPERLLIHRSIHDAIGRIEASD